MICYFLPLDFRVDFICCNMKANPAGGIRSTGALIGPPTMYHGQFVWKFGKVQESIRRVSQ